MTVLGPEALPPGYASVNPFVVVDGHGGAPAFIDFLVGVYGGREHRAARTTRTDDRVIHAEVGLGTATVMLADAMPGWAAPRALLQVYVDALEPVVAAAVDHGAVVVTEPTDFYGDQRLARLRDPWGNLWWLFEYGAASTAPGELPDVPPSWRPDADAEPSYVFRTVDEELRGWTSLTRWPSGSPSQDQRSRPSPES